MHDNQHFTLKENPSSSSITFIHPHYIPRILLSLFPQLASPIVQRKLIKILSISAIVLIIIILNFKIVYLQEFWVWAIYGDVEAQEMEIMRKSLNVPSEPLRCKKSAALEFSPSLLKEYGNVEDNWCELMTTAARKRKRTSHNSDEEEFFSATSFPDLNGSTYFRYPHSAGEPGWNYFQCPVQHRIRCNNKNNNNNDENGHRRNKIKKTKALVIYIVTSSLDSYQAHQETNNFEFFLKNGLVPANTPTALFDSVDFVFAKIQLQGEKTDREFLDCGRLGELKNEKQNSAYSNIQFLMIPKVPCDLCAHAKILEYLKVAKMPKYFSKNGGSLDHDPKLEDEDLEQLDQESEYDQVIMMNNGMRGPFFNSADDSDDSNDDHQHHPRTTWIDFVSMAGRRKIPNPRSGFFAHRTNGTLKEIQEKRKRRRDQHNSDKYKYHDEEEIDCPIHVSTSTSISWETRIHHQSFFLAEPIEILKTRIFPLFRGTCPASRDEFDKTARLKAFDNCIVNGEVTTGLSVLWQSPKWAMYSLSKQMYVHDLERDSLKKKNQYYHPIRNPSMTWTDPCKSVFVKDGGLVWKKREVRPAVLNAVNYLTMGASLKHKSNNIIGNKNQNREKNGGDDNNNKNDIASSWDWNELDEMFEKHGCPWTWSSDKEFTKEKKDC